MRLQGVEPLRYNFEEVAGHQDSDSHSYDGFQDVSLKFTTAAIVDATRPSNNGDEVTLTLTAELYDGTTIEVQDIVVIHSKDK